MAGARPRRRGALPVRIAVEREGLGAAQLGAQGGEGMDAGASVPQGPGAVDEARDRPPAVRGDVPVAQGGEAEGQA